MKTLGLVSLMELLIQVLGFRRAVDDGIVADVPFLTRRSPKDIRRRHWADGTALSAPTPMLIIQAVATACALCAGPRARVLAARALGSLGSVYVFGYAAEKVFRESLKGSDRGLMRITFGGFLGALLMAILGFAVGRGAAKP